MISPNTSTRTPTLSAPISDASVSTLSDNVAVTLSKSGSAGLYLIPSSMIPPTASNSVLDTSASPSPQISPLHTGTTWVMPESVKYLAMIGARELSFGINRKTLSSGIASDGAVDP